MNELGDEIKERLLNGGKEIVFVKNEVTFADGWEGTAEDYKGDLGFMPKVIFELALEHGVGFPYEIVRGAQGDGDIIKSRLVGISQKDCNPDQQKEIIERNKKVEKFKGQLNRTKGKYTDGMDIVVPIYSIYDRGILYNDHRCQRKDLKPFDNIKLSFSLEELKVLAEAGIVPEDFNFGRDQRNLSLEISELGKEKMTTRIFGKIKELLGRLFNKEKEDRRDGGSR